MVTNSYVLLETHAIASLLSGTEAVVIYLERVHIPDVGYPFALKGENTFPSECAIIPIHPNSRTEGKKSVAHIVDKLELCPAYV